PIAEAVSAVADALKKGGRLVYIGAGTSGRMGVLDASECPPTFNSDPAQVVGLIAGGDTALRTAIEGAEDHPEFAEADLAKINLSDSDVLVGIAASGRTPYVVGGLAYAQKVGAVAVGFTCNENNRLAAVSDILICPVVGPEILSGSTRMKAGTATKLVLNMLTTGAMVLLGKSYGNLMVDLQATNSKLIDRSARIVCEMTDLARDEAESLLARCDGMLKVAIVSHMKQVEPDAARQLLDEANGHLRTALK
ncbi:MAG: N-acetylmuramic acid 6-phosphate etherase, partial [Planctomycetota bacterium]